MNERTKNNHLWNPPCHPPLSGCRGSHGFRAALSKIAFMLLVCLSKIARFEKGLHELPLLQPWKLRQTQAHHIRRLEPPNKPNRERGIVNVSHRTDAR